MASLNPISELSAAERRVLLVLQEAPMLPWRQAAKVLNMVEGAPQRIWKRVEEVFGARIKLDPQPATFAAPHILMDIRTSPGEERAVAETIVLLPYTYYVMLRTGDYDISAQFDWGIRDLEDIQHEIGKIPGVVEVRLILITGTLRRSGRWQLPATNDADRQLVADARAFSVDKYPQAQHVGIESLNPVSLREIVEQMRIDARISLRELHAAENAARALHGLPAVSEITTRRARATILNDPSYRVTLRLRSYMQSIVIHTIILRQDPAKRSDLLAALAEAGDSITYAFETTGRLNTRIQVSLRSGAELTELIDGLILAGAQEVTVERAYAAGFGTATVKRDPAGMRSFPWRIPPVSAT